jgi:hypothetical protein
MHRPLKHDLRSESPTPNAHKDEVSSGQDAMDIENNLPRPNDEPANSRPSHTYNNQKYLKRLQIDRSDLFPCDKIRADSNVAVQNIHTT